MEELYYTLEIQYEKDGPWTTQFGDEELEIVLDEREDSYPVSEIYAWRITGKPEEVNPYFTS